MRRSCNGCRVLRKGCSEECVIRGSIEWMQSPKYQANATLFLAKFYGRAGLLNLLSASHTLRPAIFKSLLYEACGRIVEPVHGSAGLMCSGQWQHCEAAVDAVLKGLPILQLHNHQLIAPDAALKLCDIRHVSSGSVKRTACARPNLEEAAREHDHQDDSMCSNETVEPKMARSWPQPVPDQLALDLTLGITQSRSTCF